MTTSVPVLHGSLVDTCSYVDHIVALSVYLIVARDCNVVCLAVQNEHDLCGFTS